MQAILEGKKEFVTVDQVPQYKIPPYGELGIKNVWPQVSQLPKFEDYLPDNYRPSNPRMDKRFFWGVLGGAYPGLVEEMLHESRSKRLERREAAKAPKRILKITDKWLEALKNAKFEPGKSILFWLF
jgi:hypothetical protein